jgi:addiction module RelE/StbE family toxin
VKIRFSGQARADLKEIFDYIANDSRKYAQKTRASLIVRAEELAQFPFAGRVNEKFNDPNLREVIYGNYRIAYHIEYQVIIVLTIQHTAKSQE